MYKVHYHKAGQPLPRDTLFLTTKPPGISGGIRPQKIERLRRPWSYLTVSTTGPLDW